MAENNMESKAPHQKKKERGGASHKTKKEIEDEEKQILTGMNLEEDVLKILLGADGPIFQPSESSMARDQRNNVRLRTIAAGPFQQEDLQNPVIQGILGECDDSSLFGTKKIDKTVVFHGEFRFADSETACRRVEEIMEISKGFKAFVKPVLTATGCSSYKEYYEKEFYGLTKVHKQEQRSDRLLVAYNIPETAQNPKDLRAHFPFCSDIFLAKDEKEQLTGLVFIEYNDSTTMKAALREFTETPLTVEDQKISVYEYSPGCIPKEKASAAMELLVALYKYIDGKGSRLNQKQQQILEKKVRGLESKLSHTAKKLPWEKKQSDKKKETKKKKTGLLGDSPMSSARFMGNRSQFGMGRGFHRGFMDDTMVGYGFQGRGGAYGQQAMGHPDFYGQNYAASQGYGYHNSDEETMENLIRGLSQVMENLKVSHQREQGQTYGQQHQTYMGGYGDASAYSAAMNGQRSGRQRSGVGRGRGYGHEYWS